VRRVTGGVAADLLFCDPPYGVAYQTKLSHDEAVARNRRRDGWSGQRRSRNGGDASPGHGRASDRGGSPARRGRLLRLRPCRLLAGWGYGPHLPPRCGRRGSAAAAGHRLGQGHLRDGPPGLPLAARGHPLRVEGGRRPLLRDDRTLDTVWEIPRPKRSEHHPTTKPLELVARALRNSTRTAQAVLDVFMGSGSTLIACEQLGRRCLGIEIDPRYADVCVMRCRTRRARAPCWTGTGGASSRSGASGWALRPATAPGRG